jgi:hypothetical protein
VNLRSQLSGNYPILLAQRALHCRVDVQGSEHPHAESLFAAARNPQRFRAFPKLA